MAFAQEHSRSAYSWIRTGSRSGPRSEGRPMSELNTTPLIDVLLVLLIMFILTIPVATHSLAMDLPSGNGPIIERTRNAISITERGAILWNGEAVTENELAAILYEVDQRDPEPATLFEPDANAQYLITARVIRIVKRSGISNFGLNGNEKYRTFGKQE